LERRRFLSPDCFVLLAHGRATGKKRPGYLPASRQGPARRRKTVSAIGTVGSIIQLFDPPWAFPDAITGQGSIAGATVARVSTKTQLAMRAGSTLPDGQRRDLELLAAD
jgi:hypothetical protein